MKYALPTLLTILQQGEYDRRVFWHWVKTKRSSAEVERLNQIKPERWTPKLRLIRRVAGILSPVVGAARAVIWASLLTELPQYFFTGLILWFSARRLRHLQEQGLAVIAVAGSYGKTTTKQHLRHLLSSSHYTLMTPESVNTPLGIAAIIRHQLTPKHSVFIVEFGEQKAGDLRRLNHFVRPDITVVTPIGFAHSEHFGSEKKLTSAFTELTNHPYQSALFLVDDHNRGIFDPTGETVWYGTKSDSPFRLSDVKSTFRKTTAVLHSPQGKLDVATTLWGEHQLASALPGIALMSADKTLPDFARLLKYMPTVPRRLEIHHNFNGTDMVDNSYNTNPGSWKQMKELVASLSPKKVVVVTSGFVELDSETVEKEHSQLGQDLQNHTSGVVIIRSRYNKTLRERLAQHASKKESFWYAEADSLNEGLEIIRHQRWPLEVLWLEGGCRELYQ